MSLVKTRRFRILVTSLISVLFLYLAVRSVDIEEAWSYIGSFDLRLMLIGLLVWLFGYAVRGWRWLIFLKNLSSVRWYDSFRVLMSGFAMNNLLPLRAGEFVRAYLLHRSTPKITTSSAFATVAGERVFDGIAVVIVTYLGALSLDLPNWAMNAMKWSSILFFLAFLSFLGLVLYPKMFQKAFGFFSDRLPNDWGNKLDGILSRFIEGLGVLKSKKSILVLLLMSVGIWLIEVVFYYFSALSFGIPLSFMNACFLMGILNLAIMIPAGPGGVGTFEFVTVQSLLLLGVDGSLSFGYGVVSHIVQNGSVIIIGLYYLSQMGFQIADFRKTQNQKTSTNNVEESDQSRGGLL